MQKKLKLCSGAVHPFFCFPSVSSRDLISWLAVSSLLSFALSHFIWFNSLNVKYIFCVSVAFIGNLSSLFKICMKNFSLKVNSKTCIGLFFCTGRHHPSFNQAQKNSLFFPRFIIIWHLHTFLQFTKTGEIISWVLLPSSFWKDENEWTFARCQFLTDPTSTYASL